MDEVWKDVRGYEGIYKVSNFGRIKSLCRTGYGGKPIPERILKPQQDRYGYPVVGLHKNGKAATKTIHRIVAESFIDNPNCLKEVNHKDENKWNNRIDNLEWCTTHYNLTYGHRLDCARGEKNHLHKLTAEQVKEIRRVYKKGDLEYGQSALGKKYGVSHVSIAWIVKRKSWKHIKED